jgi:hypothetical protein
LRGGRAQNELEILDRDRLTELAMLTTEAAPEEVSTIAT